MSFPRYPEYKRTVDEWLGELPIHWRAPALAYRYRVDLGKMLDEKRIGGECLAPYLRNIDVQWDSINVEDLPVMDFEGKDLIRYSVSVGDLLVCEGGDVGRAAIWNGALSTCFYQKALHRLRPLRADADVPRFMFYLLSASSTSGRFNAYSGKSTIAHLTAEGLRRYRFGFPPAIEQKAIVEFLDRETSKIDALVAEQEKLIALLKEKRQALISHTVTKGLDPNVPMKDSGIEWLGQVPAHWKVGPLKRFWSVTDCKHVTAEFIDDGIALASIREVQSRYVDLERAKRTTLFYYEQLIEGDRLPQPGDLIFSRNATVGEVAQVPVFHEQFAMGQDVCLLRRCEESYSPDYMQHVIRSPVVVEQLNTLMIGSTFKRVNVEQIRTLPVPSPPGEEQQEIAAKLEVEAGDIGLLIGEAERAIALFKERRSALISAAVTGKIDVRGLATSAA